MFDTFPAVSKIQRLALIVYHSTREKFLADSEQHAIEGLIETAYINATGRYASQAEHRAWQQSLGQMAEVLRDEEMPESLGVAVEFGIPQTSKRIDFILSGLGDASDPRIVIVELKQWSSSRVSEHDGLVFANRGGHAEIEGPHPCYQAWSYAALLEGFNEAVHEGGIRLNPCAYLHNYQRDGQIDDARYDYYIEKAPLFLRGHGERQKLQAFIKQHLRQGDGGEALFSIENGRIRPSKMLADSLAGMLKGNREFVLIDDQKVVYETCMDRARTASEQRKRVVIVRGGPGTGKSVVAINLMVALTRQGLLAKYVSKNAAPRAVYESRLKGQQKRAVISAMFGGSGAYVDVPSNTFDALVVDEAHRLNEKSGLYGNLGENQVKELINAAKCTVFFVDDNQMVTLNDIGQEAELVRWAEHFQADITVLDLASQFRCGGSDGYLAWLDDTLGIRETANKDLHSITFDFRVFDSPSEMYEAVAQRNASNNKSRVVAGYCWDWKSKKDSFAHDISFPEFDFHRQWNLASDQSLWITAPKSIEQIGCIHTCQGLELDYVGVIIGPDLRMKDGVLHADPSGRAKMDRSIRGWKTRAQSDPAGTMAKVDHIIRNTYRTLMTRGMKGCYVYCVDPELAAYLRQRQAGH